MLLTTRASGRFGPMSGIFVGTLYKVFDLGQGDYARPHYLAIGELIGEIHCIDFGPPPFL
jgi:hypothetical protein